VVIHKVALINKEKSSKKENIVVTVININSLNANLKDAPFISSIAIELLL